MRTFYVHIDDYVGPFKAQTSGRTWNGWECPHFTLETGFDVCAAVISSGGMAGYDPQRDAFWTVDLSSSENGEAQSLADVGISDPDYGVDIDWWERSEAGLYPIGAMSWIWDAVDIERLSAMFVDYVRDELTDDEMEEVKRRNATPEYARACATHDFRDANEFMTAAFEAYFGREANPTSQHDTDVWNAAWELARHGELTAQH